MNVQHIIHVPTKLHKDLHFHMIKSNSPPLLTVKSFSSFYRNITYYYYRPFNTEDKSECNGNDCSLFFGVFCTTLAGAGAVSDGERPRAQAGVDNRGMKRQFDADFEPDGGLDACELPLSWSTRVSIAMWMSRQTNSKTCNSETRYISASVPKCPKDTADLVPNCPALWSKVSCHMDRSVPPYGPKCLT